MSKIKIFSLGGLNEKGKNMYVIEVDKDIFVFDAGSKYAEGHLLGIDYVIPDLSYLKENVDRVKGIFITHPHDEHIGALPNVINELPNVKIYGTMFTIDTIKRTLEEINIPTTNIVEISPHKKIVFGENSIFPISLTHSVPESVGYVLNTKDGAIFYTGNFVFDSTMRGYYKTDIGKLAYVGKQGVLCLLSESLYSDRKGYTSPNHRLSSLINEMLIRKEERIIFHVISTNIYRLQELFNEVLKTQRKIVIMGKKLQKIINYVLEKGYVKFDKSRIGDLTNINDRDVLILTSSDNDKPFVNIEKILSGYDKFITVKPTDTFIFLEPISDDLEKSAVKITDKIAKIGPDVIILSTDKYLSHHASSEDLMLMLDLINPKYYFPVIGEYRHQVENADIASIIGIPKDNILLKENGDVITFENGNLIDKFEKVKVGNIMIDGISTEDVGELVIKDREMLSDNGIVIISSTLDKKTKQLLAGPEIITRGFIYVKESSDMIKEIGEISLKILNENISNNYVDYNNVKNSIREEVGRYLYMETETRPMIITVMQEI
ncbi:MAG: ribonuclease J [Bacilli bacterium]|nr:ribonuclease J [Bacilli bacterium]